MIFSSDWNAQERNRSAIQSENARRLRDYLRVRTGFRDAIQEPFTDGSAALPEAAQGWLLLQVAPDPTGPLWENANTQLPPYGFAEVNGMTHRRTLCGGCLHNRAESRVTP